MHTWTRTNACKQDEIDETQQKRLVKRWHLTSSRLTTNLVNIKCQWDLTNKKEDEQQTQKNKNQMSMRPHKQKGKIKTKQNKAHICWNVPASSSSLLWSCSRASCCNSGALCCNMGSARVLVCGTGASCCNIGSSRVVCCNTAAVSCNTGSSRVCEDCGVSQEKGLLELHVKHSPTHTLHMRITYLHI